MSYKIFPLIRLPFKKTLISFIRVTKCIIMQLRIGILGAGAFASRRHLPELISDSRVSVAAACRRDPKQLAIFADHFGIPNRYLDWREMLENEPLDGVVIATPHDVHYEQAAVALRKGLHVLLEKPMTLNPQEAEELEILATNQRLCFVVAFNPPYWPHTEALREGIIAGRIGDLECIELSWIGSVDAVFGRAPMTANPLNVVQPTLFRSDASANGGGGLMDGGGHLISELLWVTGLSIERLVSITDRYPDDRRATVSMMLSGGVPATIHYIGNSAYQQRRLRSTYYGTLGTAFCCGLPFKISWETNQGLEIIPEDAMPSSPTPVKDWLDCIASGKMPRGTAVHGVQITRALAIAYESARKHSID